MRKILVPLDGSPLSETAIPYALALARGTDAELCLLSVWEVLPEELETVGANHAKTLRQQGVRHFRAYLDNVAQTLTCPVCCEVRSGHPAFEILLAASQMEVDLIVMASHGRRGPDERRRGSVADKVLRGCTAPVLIVGPDIIQGGEPPPAVIRSLLLPLDGSAESEAALDVALETARLTGAQITLLRVVPTPPPAGEAGEPASYPPSLERDLVRSSRSYLNRFKVAHPDLVASMVVERGRPAEAILEFAKQISPDLVVMSTRSRYGGGRWALGSVADDVIEGPVPVVLVHPEGGPHRSHGQVAFQARAG
jgi:nucleotide-binding universal stress UspA family protein